jgi:hypothetical protein
MMPWRSPPKYWWQQWLPPTGPDQSEVTTGGVPRTAECWKSYSSLPRARVSFDRSPFQKRSGNIWYPTAEATHSTAWKGCTGGVYGPCVSVESVVSIRSEYDERPRSAATRHVSVSPLLSCRCISSVSDPLTRRARRTRPARAPNLTESRPSATETYAGSDVEWRNSIGPVPGSVSGCVAESPQAVERSVSTAVRALAIFIRVMLVLATARPF